MDDKLKINNQQYKIIDTKEKMTVPDCFVLNSNKIGKGNGEAKFYVEMITMKQEIFLEKEVLI